MSSEVIQETKELKIEVEEFEGKMMADIEALKVSLDEAKKIDEEWMDIMDEENAMDRERLLNQQNRLEIVSSQLQQLSQPNVNFDEFKEIEKRNREYGRKLHIREMIRRERQQKKAQEKIERENKLEWKFFKGSTLLNEEQYQQLQKECDFDYDTWTGIFKASKHGYKSANFHDQVDGIPNTLIIIKSAQRKRIFGGFNPFYWNGYKSEYQRGGRYSHWYRNQQYFNVSGVYLFGFERELVDGMSTSNKVSEKLIKFKQNKGHKHKSTIFCSSSTGPCFGGPVHHALRISNDCKMNKTSTTKLSKEANGFDDKGKGTYFLNHGKGNFRVFDYEVFTRTENLKRLNLM